MENNIRHSLPETLAMGSKTTFTSNSFQSNSESFYKSSSEGFQKSSSESFHTEEVIDKKLEKEETSKSSQYFGHLDCGPTQCTYIACTVGPLKKKEYVVFRVRSRLWTTTVAKVKISMLPFYVSKHLNEIYVQAIFHPLTHRLRHFSLKQLAHHEYEISSRMVARISELPHKVDPSYLGLKTFTVTSRVIALSVSGDLGGVGG